MNYSRRNFCQTMIAGVAISAAGGCQALGCGGKKPQAAVQLYSVRNLCSKDFAGVLKQLKAMGYEGVEFAGYYGKTAKELKQMLGDLGLKPAGTHINANELRPQNIGALLDFANELGNPYIVCPGGGFKQGSESELKEMADLFAQAAATAKPRGIRIGYHNHQHEFEKKFVNNTKCAWELFFDQTSPDVFTQLDIGHCQAKNQDPMFWLRKYPGRAVTVHIKENYAVSKTGILARYHEGADPSKGVKWDEVFPFLASHGCEQYVVECESDPSTLSAVEGCIQYMRAKKFI